MAEEERSFNETLGSLLRLVTKRGWLVLVTACGVALAGLAVIHKLPNQYTSEATILVIRQQVPERYVVPTSTSDINAALNALKQEVLSRTRLTKIIADFDLYQDPNKHVAPETLVDLMLRNTEIEPIIDNPNRRDFDAFKISFVAGSPALAQSVVGSLTSMFINEHLRSRSEQANTTTNFLRDQVTAKARQLQEQEQKLRDFKLQHIGELPEQQAGNLGILSGLQGQLQSTTANLGRAQERRVYLETLLNSYKRPPATIPALPMAGIAAPSNRPLTPLEAAQNEVARIQAERTSLLNRNYTPDHPDVARKNRELAQAEDVVKRLRSSVSARPREESGSAAGRTAAPAVSADIADDPATAQLKSQLESNRLEIENLSKEEKRLKAAIAQYESRLNQTPVREQQEAGITRETEALRQEYAELQKKEQDSQLATNLEKEQVGQQFRLVDPPSLPLLPSKPKRLQLSLGAVGAGFVFGLALVLFLEMRDTSFRSEKDLSKRFSPPFIIGVPDLPTPGERVHRKWLAAVQWMTSAAMFCIVLAAEYYFYRHG